MCKVALADEEAGDAAEALAVTTAAAAATAAPLQWGKEGAGGSSNSPVFKAAIRSSPGISRGQIKLPEYVEHVIDEVKEAVAAAGPEAPAKLLYPAYHMLANFALNDFGTQAAVAIQGIFEELGTRLSSLPMSDSKVSVWLPRTHGVPNLRSHPSVI